MASQKMIIPLYHPHLTFQWHDRELVDGFVVPESFVCEKFGQERKHRIEAGHSGLSAFVQGVLRCKTKMDEEKYLRTEGCFLPFVRYPRHIFGVSGWLMANCDAPSSLMNATNVRSLGIAQRVPRLYWIKRNIVTLK